MRSTLPLAQGGTLEYDDEVLIVKDKKVRWSFHVMHITSIMWVPLSLVFMYQKNFDPDSFLVWVYGFVFVAQLIVAISFFWLSWQEEIWFDEVKSAKVKTGFNNANLILYLEDGKQRRIHAKYDQAPALRNLAGVKLTA